MTSTRPLMEPKQLTSPPVAVPPWVLDDPSNGDVNCLGSVRGRVDVMISQPHHIWSPRLVEAMRRSENCRLVEKRATALHRKSIAEGVFGAKHHSPWPISLSGLCTADNAVV